MKYAVIKLSGKQYKVIEGEKLLVDKLDKIIPVQVLLFRDEEKVSIGKPYLENVKVTYSKDEVVKGKKIDVFKYKAKSRYRKHTGFRAQLTPIVIQSISS